MNRLLPDLYAEAHKKAWDALPAPTEEITFEMAQTLGLIPQYTNRYTVFSMPFESRYAFEKRCEAAEYGYQSEDRRLREKFKVVVYQGRKLNVV